MLNGQYGHEWTGLVRRLIDANFTPREDRRYPRIEAVGIEHHDVTALANAYSALATSRAITPIREDDREFRRLLGLPPVSDTVEQMVEVANETPA